MAAVAVTTCGARAQNRLNASQVGRRRPSQRLRPKTVPLAAPTASRTSEYLWKGSDEFSSLDDRKDLPPLPLPAVPKPVRVALVRHGQSTWNAEGRIQGSTNFAVLTPKGISQAETTHEMLEKDMFNALFHSPLERAKHTAEIVWGKRTGPVQEFPCLREVDLYSFQGLLKEEGIQRYGEQFKAWQKDAANFEIDGHAPVRELWYRGSLAWQEVLGRADTFSTALVVAHNAVNQAMIATALGLPPAYFRRILQSNGATSVLDLSPPITPGNPVRVTVDRLNQSPGSPFLSGAGRKAAARLVLVRHAATYGTEDGLLLGSTDEACSPLGEVHAQKVGELLMDTEIGALYSSPLGRAITTASSVAVHQKFSGREPKVQTMEELLPPNAGEFTGMRLRDIRGQGGMTSGADQMKELWQRVDIAWEKLTAAADCNGGQTVVVVAHATVVAALLCRALSLPQSSANMFRIDTAGVSLIDFPDGAAGSLGNIRCTNYTAHLGRWSVPVTPDDLDLVCGVDGCF